MKYCSLGLKQWPHTCNNVVESLISWKMKKSWASADSDSVRFHSASILHVETGIIDAQAGKHPV